MTTMKQQHPFFLVCLMWTGFAMATAFGMPLNGQTPEDVLEVQCEGALGRTQAGMTIEVKQETITGGHYFFANDLQVIPITGAIHDGRIAISGGDGSSFDLRFKDNGSEHGEKLS